MNRHIAPPVPHEPHQRCSLCRLKLPATHFHYSAKWGRQGICKLCRRVYQADYRAWKRANA